MRARVWLLALGLGTCTPLPVFAVCPNAETSSCIKDDAIVLDTGQTLDEAIAAGVLGPDQFGPAGAHGDISVAGTAPNQTIEYNAASIEAGDLALGAVALFTEGSGAPVADCNTKDLYRDTANVALWVCADGATNTWAALTAVDVDTGSIIDLSTPCPYLGAIHLESDANNIFDLAVCVDVATNQWRFFSSGVPLTTAWTDYPDNLIPHYVVSVPRAGTVSGIQCITTGTASPTVPITLEQCDAAGANCTEIESAITCDADGALQSGPINAPTLTANNWIRVTYGTPSGTWTSVTTTLRYRVIK